VTLTRGDGLIVSRRSFLKSFGTTAAAAATAQVEVVAQELQKANAEKDLWTGGCSHHPERQRQVPQSSTGTAGDIAGSLTQSFRPQPAQRRSANRATCGACTVLLDGTPIYSCSKLAIEAQGPRDYHNRGPWPKMAISRTCNRRLLIKTGLMCGYCTPGFVMSVYRSPSKYATPDCRPGKARVCGQSMPVRDLSPNHAIRLSKPLDCPWLATPR